MQTNFRIALLVISLFLPINSFAQKQKRCPLPQNNAKYIFFDVGHVLFKPSKTHAAWQIGPKNLLRYCFKHRQIPSREFLQKRLFEYINHCTNLEVHASITSCGCQIPGLIYQWLTGKASTNVMLCSLKDHPAKDYFFASHAERDLVLATTNIFIPEKFIAMQYPVTEMIDLMQECAKKYPNRVYIVSNWDESCNLLKERYSNIFDAIPQDHIFFSHEVGCCKPDAEIFDLVANKFNLDPNQCILIDDLTENITGFQQWGGQGILHINPRKTRRQLQKFLQSDLN